MKELLDQVGEATLSILNNLASLSILVGLGIWCIKVFRSHLNKTIKASNTPQNSQIAEVLERLDKIEQDNELYHKETNKNILRIQIEDGIYRKKFSEEEVLERYDRYSKDFNGNGYITGLVHDYLETLRKG